MKRNELTKFAAQIRLETLKQFANLGFGHVGGTMSVVELIAVLYGKVMNIDPKDPKKEDRDWLICSKGHAGPTIYSALALKGYFDKKQLLTLNQGGTSLPSHCDRNLTTGIDMTTGSLGQGMSVAVGVAMGHRYAGKDNYVYLIVGDGELDEGQNWEAIMFAKQFNIDNMIVFVDYNKKQLDGTINEIMELGDIAAKFKEFGWHTQDISGHDVEAIEQAIEIAKNTKGRPSVIVLNTKKGKGCCFAEEMKLNHHIGVCKEDGENAVAQAQEMLNECE